MEFTIKRTSDDIPCENAIQTNPDVWVIDIDSLDELLELVAKCEQDIIIKEQGKFMEDTWVHTGWELEIYDDYRE